ncbi:serine hydrolase domain-containing protein [Gorillibacterium timonense]|uniref:serine hydrolase domain-containing protein n=1 Tax=Gorillibacterium timonense TaxID=1689269 RepID=UPI00071CBDE0|nr:serine hydrolase [Gorillibacterium timonense]
MSIEKAIEETIEEAIGSDFCGCVSIKKDGSILFQHAYGYADKPNQIPNRIDTKFPTASAGKAFVAVGILQLIERGKLKWDDTLGSLLNRDWKGIDREITVRQLLTHTSGIPDYFDESVMDDYAELWVEYPNYKIRRSADLLPLFLDKPMMYPRGERFLYNNTGYAVLGLILEEVAGVPFDDYLQEQVFLPCGMTGTGYYELDRLPAGCANAYIYDDARKEYYTNIYSVDVKGTGAGGAFTTVLDVDRFWEGLLEGRLLSDSMVEQMLARQSGDENCSYGYGVWLKVGEDGGLIPYFQGFDPGVSFLSRYYPSQRTSCTLVSNLGCNVWELERALKKVL